MVNLREKTKVKLLAKVHSKLLTTLDKTSSSDLSRTLFHLQIQRTYLEQ